MTIPLSDLAIQYKQIKKEVDKKIIEIVSSGHYIKGPNLTKFEKEFAKFCGTKYAAGVASGTDALKLSLASLNITKGDEVILPVNTFVATAYAVLATGATPVLVDVDPVTLSMDPVMVEKAVSKKTKAIIPVHLYGYAAKMDELLKIAKKHNLYVVEDSAQAHGAAFKNKKVGNLGTISAFSFYPGKNLGAYGDGGGITTNSKSLYERVLKLREYGGSKYFYTEVGTNSRLDEIQAGILLIKLKQINKWNNLRRNNALYYNQQLNKLIPEIKLVYPYKNTVPVYHLFVIRTGSRDGLSQFLEKKGILTGIHYPVPLHLQKSLEFLGYKKGQFPVAEKAAKEILSLPMYAELTKKQIDIIVHTIRKYFDEN